MRLGVAHVPDGRGTFTGLTVEENLRLGAYTRRDRDACRRGFRARLRLFPAPRRAAAAAGRHAVRRRAADAGDRPRADAAAAAPAARRAVLRPGAASWCRRSSPSSAPSTARRGSSMLLVEQNANMALELADHAYLIETGRIVMGGPAADHRQRRIRPPRLSRLLRSDAVDSLPAPDSFGPRHRRHLCEHRARAGDDLPGDASREFRPGRAGDVLDLYRLDADRRRLCLLARLRADARPVLRRRRR